MPRIEDLQRNVRDLQGAAALPDELQRLLQGLQAQLSTLRKSQPARRPRIPQVDPTPPDVPLQGNLLAIYQIVVQLHRAFCQYAGEVNRDQWLHLLDVAADAVAAGTGAGYVMEAPNGTQQPWARNGATEQWELAFALNGVTNGSQAQTGQVGELVEQLTPGWPTQTIPILINATNSIPLVQVALSPGDWDVSGYATWNPTVPTPASTWFSAFGALSYSPIGPAILDASALTLQSNAGVVAVPIVTHGINVSAPTTVFVIANLSSPNTNDTGKIAQAWGYIHARRMR